MLFCRVAAGIVVAILFGCGRGSTPQQPARSSVSPTGSSDHGADRTFQSTRNAFEWRLPSDWRFATPEEIELPPKHPAVEAVAALTETDDDVPIMLLQVTEVFWIDDAEVWSDLERDSTEWLKRAGVTTTGSSRIRVLGGDALRVDGHYDAEGVRLHMSVVSFFRNRRRFRLHCQSTREESWTPCAGALGGLKIDDMPDTRGPNDKPRILHLRAEKYGLEFDAPDDSWLATGPRMARGGIQLVWYWVKDGRQIDVHVLDHAGVGDRIDEATYAKLLSDNFQESGGVVTMKRSKLAGLPCSHLEVNRSDGYHQDLYLQKRGEILYSVLVTVPIRDKALLDRVRAGVRIAEPQK